MLSMTPGESGSIRPLRPTAGLLLLGLATVTAPLGAADTGVRAAEGRSDVLTAPAAASSPYARPGAVAGGDATPVRSAGSAAHAVPASPAPRPGVRAASQGPAPVAAPRLPAERSVEAWEQFTFASAPQGRTGVRTSSRRALPRSYERLVGGSSWQSVRGRHRATPVPTTSPSPTTLPNPIGLPVPTTSPTPTPTPTTSPAPTTTPTPTTPPSPTTSQQPRAFRAFSADSPWNRVLPASAPVHPDSARIVSNIKANNVNNGCVTLSGTGTNTWGTPIYWADADDPTYAVTSTRYYLPPEFASLRIPRGAKPMAADDREMTVYDLERGYVAWLYEAMYDGATDRWSASGGSIAYLGSNGVLGSLPGSDERRNTGSHRGLNGAVVAARHDEVKAGAVEHALRIGVRAASTQFLWPMSGSDGRSTDPYAPKQGSRLRIAPDLDLTRYGLAPDALVLAKALQRYGAVIGDSTGAPVELKLEDTVQQGRGQLWSLPQNALCAIPIEAFQVLSEDFR
jgi:hypothetical protein